MRLPPYTILWADNTADPDSNAGVAIIYRSSNALTVSSHTPSPTGRLQSLRVDWAGHSFTLINTYWPSTGPAARAVFLSTHLSPALLCQHPPLLLGDFNFTALLGS